MGGLSNQIYLGIKIHYIGLQTHRTKKEFKKNTELQNVILMIASIFNITTIQF